MQIEINTLYWNNAQHLINAQKSVMDHFELPVKYYNIDGMRHGQWMDAVIDQSDSDIVGFFDSDCVPLNKEIIETSVAYVAKHKSFIGLAQSTNHIFPYSHVFAAPSFFFIWKETWLQLGKPTFLETPRSDVAEEVSYFAEQNKVPYKAIYPTHFEREPIEGVWRLGNYGYFGIGTVFGGSVYHLYQGRYGNNADLFAERCKQIVDGTFSVDGMYLCKEEYNGNICR